MSRLLRVSLLALVLPLLVLVGPAKADEVIVDPNAVTWGPEPTVARIGPGLKLTLTLATHVYDLQGVPKAGERIKFTLVAPWPGLFTEPRPGLGAIEVCEAVTDANGFASCKGKGLLASIVSILAGGAWATRLSGPFGTDEYVKLPIVLTS